MMKLALHSVSYPGLWGQAQLPLEQFIPRAKKLGYEQAQAVAGGLKSWKDANLPVEKA